MRNLSLLGCALMLMVGSGCRSGSSGFHNPFSRQLARSLPRSSSVLELDSKQDRHEFAGDDQAVARPSGPATTGPDSPSGSQDVADWKQEPHASSISSDLSQGDRALVEGERLKSAGRHQEAAERFQQAAEFYQKVIELDPQNLKAHHHLAVVYDKQEMYQSAEKQYEAALSIDRENLSILNDLGYSYYLQQRYEDSKAYLEYALQIDRDNRLALSNLALVHAAEGNVQQAYALFQQGGVDAEQSQQLIQQALARAGERKVSTRRDSLGIASTRHGLPSDEGIASLGSDSPGSASVLGRAETRPSRSDAFQPRPDWESAYGLSANKLPGSVDPAASAGESFIHSPASSELPSQPAMARHERVDGPTVEQVSYNRPVRPEVPSASNAEIIRAALNTGYGNLFPVIAPEDYYRTQRETVTNFDATDARNAYYEEFGRPGSSTPHVVHATMSRQVDGEKGAAARSGNSDLTAQRVSFDGSSRIQSPNYGSDQRAAATPRPPANSFPVTQAHGQIPETIDYSRFPQQERPLFSESAGSTSVNEPAGSGASGAILVPATQERSPAGPASAATAPQKDWQAEYEHLMRTQPGVDHSYFLKHHQQTNVREDGANELTPMSEEDRKAHELALEHYRRSQQ